MMRVEWLAFRSSSTNWFAGICGKPEKEFNAIRRNQAISN